MKDSKKINIYIMIVPLMLVLMIAIVSVIFPTQFVNIVNDTKTFCTQYFTTYYCVFGVGMFVLALTLATSKIGSIKLSNDEPLSTLTWGSMIFTSTMAADILFYSLHEWMYYFNVTTYFGAPQSVRDSVEQSMTYSLFHWGFIPWSIYIVLAVIFAYMFYVSKRKFKQTSAEVIRPLFHTKVTDFVINCFSIFALLCGTSTTFSVATPLMSAIVSRLFNIPQSHFLSIAILVVVAVIYTAAVLSRKGLQIVAKLTTVLFSLLLLVILSFSDCQFTLNLGLSSIGDMVQNFVGLSTWTDATNSADNFVQNWTVFYWSYWIAWSVATPIFIAKISKGRTIRQVILGGGLAGLLGTFTTFIVISGFGLHLQQSDIFDAVSMIDTQSPSTVIVEMLSSSVPAWVLLFILIVMICLYSSTFDALTSVVSSYSYNTLYIDREPAKRIKLFWAITFLILPIALLFLDASNEVLMSISIIAALPLTLIIVMMIIAFMKEVRYDRH